jgi:2-methylcitrate dehydratase PrpD
MGVVQAQMSLQYIIAVVLLDGAALLEQFTEAKISDPEILELATRVQVIVDPEIDKLYPERFSNRVEIILKNGECFEERIDFPKGSVERPMSFEEVAGKFRSLAGYAVSGPQAEQIVNTVERFEGLGDIRNLTRLLV